MEQGLCRMRVPMQRASRPAAATTASLASIRSWWLRRQGLTPDAAPRGPSEACVRQVGWLATYGAPGVYLSLGARMPGTSRDGVNDEAIDGVALIDVPGGHARPSVVVPRDEMALALPRTSGVLPEASRAALAKRWSPRRNRDPRHRDRGVPRPRRGTALHLRYPPARHAPRHGRAVDGRTAQSGASRCRPPLPCRRPS